MINILKRLFGIGQQADYVGLVKSGAVIVDVRSKAEFSSGHITGAINIPLDELQHQLHQLKSKTNPVITCCASGMRSAAAKKLFKSNGFKTVYNAGSWTALRDML